MCSKNTQLTESKKQHTYLLNKIPFFRIENNPEGKNSENSNEI